MKSSFWVLGSVTLLYLGVVRCSRDFLDNDEHFLDKKRDEDEERTLKDENTEWALYKAIYNWNELPKEINELSLLQRSDGAVCTNDMCFEGGTCSADNICTCAENQYFDGKQCQDFPCKLKDNKINCECPDGTVREEGKPECVAEETDKRCEKKCGYGVCVKEGAEEEMKETCRCFTIASNIDSSNENKCALKPTFCASGLVEDDNEKCKCEGKYKQAEDGISCVLNNCNDNVAKKACEAKNAKCVMDWKGNGYKCECPVDYVEDSTGICINKCKDVTCEERQKCNKDNGTCVCEDGYTGANCETLSESLCRKKIPECASTQGTCKIKDGEIECTCSDGNTFVESKGCLSPAEMRCLNFICYNGGTCNGEKDKAECKCVDGYTGDNCEILPDTECKVEKCVDTSGKCKVVNADGKVECDCGGDKTFKESRGCLSPAEMRCLNFICYNGGTCNGEKDKAECNCVDGYTGDNCEIFSESECKKRNETCFETKGKCISIDEENVKCECPKDTRFVPSEGCKDVCEIFVCYNDGECQKENGVAKCKCKEGFTGKNCEKFPDEKCNEVIENCVETKGVCTSVAEKDVKCICKKDFVFVENEGCQNIEEVNCKEVCGENPDVVICGGDKKNQTKIKCTCKNENEDFDKEGMECKTNYCRKKCGDVQCLGNRFEESVECNCSKPYEDFDENTKKCKTNFCKKVCGLDEETIKCETSDRYKNVKINCSCIEDGYTFKNQQCIRTCSDDSDCHNGKKCKGKEGSKTCDCKPDTFGDFCDKVVACEKGGKYENCTDGIGECKYQNGKAICECSKQNETFYEKTGNCHAQCGKNKECGVNMKCNEDNFCLCKEGYEGKDCSVVTGCKGELGEKCKKLGLDCILDENPPVKATCNCKKGFKYDPKDNECKHEFCYPVNQCKPVNCSFDESTGIAYCKCPENQFYSYGERKCKEFENKCLLRKKPCDENNICEKKTGKCKCKYSQKEGDECKRKYCDPNPCFKGANCSESDGKCFCESGRYYKNKECIKTNCNIKEYKTSCKCPVGTNRNKDGEECGVKEEEKCEKDCGYGICKIVSQKDTCKCFTFAYNNNARNGTCTIKKDYCASREVKESDPMKCKCEGKLKQADDGITCTLKTCDDDGVKEECESLGGKCVMNWKGDGYDCECPEGYDKDKDNKGKCSDPCSIQNNIKTCTDEGKVCYNSFSTNNKKTTSCNCPPTVELVNGACVGKAANAYLFKNIPVLKEKYELKSGINKVLLNKHLVQSLQQTFKKDLYEFGYLFDYNVQGDIVYCSVWVNFRKAPTDEDLKKIKAASKTFSSVCEECDDSVMIWPPNLFLSSTGLKEVEPDKQDFCKVKDRLCGKGAKCTQDENNGKCTCDEGYQVVQYGILKIGPYEVQVCEDINECALATHKCPKNTECFNTIGNYSCVCKEGFKKQKPPADPETDKSDCVDLCTPSPCKKGKCVINEKEKTFDCECEPGVAGSYCQRADEHYKSAKKSTVVVGAVLGTILIVGAIAVIYFIIKKKKRFGSEDFMPAPRMDHAEMTERRHVRGVTNKAYE